MERAKQAALKAYPDKVFHYKKIGDADGVMTGESVESQQYIRDSFIEGYEQAEKDLALTCEDIQLIIQLGEDVMTEAGGTPKDYNEEILRRFNEQKNRQ